MWYEINIEKAAETENTVNRRAKKQLLIEKYYRIIDFKLSSVDVGTI